MLLFWISNRSQYAVTKTKMGGKYTWLYCFCVVYSSVWKCKEMKMYVRGNWNGTFRETESDLCASEDEDISPWYLDSEDCFFPFLFY